MLRPVKLFVLTSLALLLEASPAFACGGLISPNGAIQLGRTTTLAAYHDGIEHYVTAFEFQGSGGKFGSIVPLPGIPTRVIKAGRWTLQRLELEVNPPLAFATSGGSAGSASAATVQVILKTKIDALDVTVLKGGGTAVGNWARERGFQLTPDAPEILDFYAARSPVFMAVSFDAERARARGQRQGDATPVHVVIPIDRPWVPLRILGLGAGRIAPIDADIFLLTDNEPALLPSPRESGLNLTRSEAASVSLLRDLGSDRGMGWLPRSGMWLSFLQLNEKAGDLTYDLAIDPTGQGVPSLVDAGFLQPAAGPAPLIDTNVIGNTNGTDPRSRDRVEPVAVDLPSPGLGLPPVVWVSIGLGALLIGLAVFGRRERADW